MKLTHNTILITGGATGIGLAMARRFAADGNQVIICGRTASSLAQAEAEVPGVITRVCDVADPTSRDALTQWLQDEHPPSMPSSTMRASRCIATLRQTPGWTPSSKRWLSTSLRQSI